MSKMGQELDRRLDENKYELLNCLKELVTLIDDIREGEYTPDSFATQPAKRVIAKVEGKEVMPIEKEIDK